MGATEDSSCWPVIATWVASLPFVTWMMRGYVEAVPEELEAGRNDRRVHPYPSVHACGRAPTRAWYRPHYLPSFHSWNEYSLA